MKQELRRFPRVPFEQAGHIQLQGGSGNGAPIPVTLRTVSCQGAGVAVDRELCSQLIPGSEARLDFQVGGVQFALPARIVWAAGAQAGIRLRLGLADSQSRDAYAAWIVPLTNREIRRMRGAE